MKKVYQKPQSEIISIKADVITGSGETMNYKEGSWANEEEW